LRVLITGGQGFAGRYLTARWLDLDTEVEIVGCGRSSANASHFRHSISVGSERKPAPLPPDLSASIDSTRYRYVSTDMLDEAGVQTMIAEVRPNVIVHVASALRDDATKTLFETNVMGTEHLFHAVALAGLSSTRIVVGSSGSVYGAVTDEKLPIDEATPTAPFDMYSISKVAQEHVARMLSLRYGIATVIVRIFNIVGAGQDERHFCGHMAAQIVDIETERRPPMLSIGPLDTTRDFIDVRDVADGLIAAATRGDSGATYNLASGREVGMQHVFDEMIAASRLPADLQILSKPARRADMPRNVASIARLSALGFAPRFSLQESLQNILDYYRGLSDAGD